MKTQTTLQIKIRKFWGQLNPSTKRLESKRRYDRNKSKIEMRLNVYC